MSKIFVSFSSKDEKIVKSFIDKVLCLGIGFDAKNIFCSSLEGSGIISGEDFKGKIENKLQEADLVLQFITSNYKESEVCLNEMGAAWIQNCKTIPLISPPIDYQNVGFIHITNQILCLDKKRDLLKFRDDLHKLFSLEHFNSEMYERQLNEFLDQNFNTHVAVKKNNKVVTPSQAQINDFFSKFLIEDINIRSLLLKAQPTLSDCQQVFSKPYYKMAFQFLNAMFLDLLEGEENLHSIYHKDRFKIVTTDYDELSKGVNKIAGGMTKNYFAFNRNVVFYKVSFLKGDDESGVSYKSWCFINNRWVFFPKPWRFISAIDSVRDNEDLKQMISVLKKFGLGKRMPKKSTDLSFFVNYIVNQLQKD